MILTMRSHRQSALHRRCGHDIRPSCTACSHRCMFGFLVLLCRGAQSLTSLEGTDARSVQVPAAVCVYLPRGERR